MLSSKHRHPLLILTVLAAVLRISCAANNAPTFPLTASLTPLPLSSFRVSFGRQQTTDTPFLSRTMHPFTSSALSIRGGSATSNLPELKTFSEAATIATGAIAAMTYFAPATATSTLYGLPNTSPLIVWLIRALGGSLAMIAIQAYCIFFKGMSYTRAIGYGCLPYMINELRTLILNETRQWDMPPWGLLFISLPISSSCAYMLISEKSFGNKVVKGFLYWVLVGNGLPLGLAPEAAAKGWGINIEEEGVVECLRLIGFAAIADAMFMMLLDRNVDGVLAFASPFLVLAVLMMKEALPRLR